METDVKVFDKMWRVHNPVTKLVSPNEDPDYPLVYLTHVDNTLAKRQETGRTWAGGRRYSKWNPKTKEYEKPEEEPLEEVTFDNEWIEGFKIADTKSRYSTSNVVWRILDPRGFQLEIYSGNLMQLLNHCTITNGTISGRCKWGRESGKNCLVPEGSKLAEAVSTNETREQLKLNAKDVNVGDIVHLIKGNGKAVYLGKMLYYSTKYIHWRYESGKRWSYYRDENAKKIWDAEIGDEIDLDLRYQSARHILVELDENGKPDYTKLVDHGTVLKVHTKAGTYDLGDVEKNIFEAHLKKDWWYQIYLYPKSAPNFKRFGYHQVCRKDEKYPGNRTAKVEKIN